MAIAGASFEERLSVVMIELGRVKGPPLTFARGAVPL
jgi:hypothetical protein